MQISAPIAPISIFLTNRPAWTEYYFRPILDHNSDMPIIGHNITHCDPRNYNLKKYMVRLTLYELSKTVAANNVSVVRMRDYEDSMKWLNDSSKLRLNPQIPKKLTEDKQPVTDW